MINWTGKQGTSEASDMGWAPGEVPRSLTVTYSGKEHRLAFVSVSSDREGDHTAFHFVGTGYDPVHLTVFND